MINFHPYASGSSANLYTISDGETAIMIECGLPWHKIRELLNFKTADIAGILISHRHFDHSKGTKDAARAGINVYGSKATFEGLNLSGHRFVEIQDMRLFSIGSWKILPFATIHDCDGSLAFLMANKENENFLYITDSQYSPVRFPPLDVIAVECNFQSDILTENILKGTLPSVVGRRIKRAHFSLETVIELLKANDLSRCRQIFLMHLSDGNSDERRMKEVLQVQTGIPVEICQINHEMINLL